MVNGIIIGILLIVLVLALMRVKRHFKGGCCGSGRPVATVKMLSDPRLGQKTLKLEGICCENCLIRVGNALNRLDGVSCTTHYADQTAIVSYSREVTDQELQAVVEKLGYSVREIL